jgi:carbonic anhydrase
MSEAIINIAPENVSGNCDQKCSYEIDKYTITNVLCQNMSDHISVNFGPETKSFCTFNQQEYKLLFMHIAQPSAMYYKGSAASADVGILHQGVNFEGMLMVIIPISVISTTSMTKSQEIVERLIKSTASYAPQMNETTSQGLVPFSIAELLPKKPYYYFSPDPSGKVHVITFGLNDSIHISQDVFSTLQTLLKPSTRQMKSPTTIQIFMNPKGLEKASTTTTSTTTATTATQGTPGQSIGLGNDIYIDCQPTGHSEETIDITKIEKKELTNTIGFFKKHTEYVTIIVSFVVFFIVLGIIYMALIYFRKKE